MDITDNEVLHEALLDSIQTLKEKAKQIKADYKSALEERKHKLEKAVSIKKRQAVNAAGDLLAHDDSDKYALAYKTAVETHKRETAILDAALATAKALHDKSRAPFLDKTMAASNEASESEQKCIIALRDFTASQEPLMQYALQQINDKIDQYSQTLNRFTPSTKKRSGDPSPLSSAKKMKISSSHFNSEVAMVSAEILCDKENVIDGTPVDPHQGLGKGKAYLVALQEKATIAHEAAKAEKAAKKAACEPVSSSSSDDEKDNEDKTEDD